MQQRRQRVRFTAAERAAELEHAVVVALAGQARQHFLQQLVQVGGDVGGGEESVRVTVDLGRGGVAGGDGAQVDGENRLGQRAAFHIGV